MVTLYSKKVENNGWGKGVVEELSTYIIQKDPSIKDFRQETFGV